MSLIKIICFLKKKKSLDNFMNTMGFPDSSVGKRIRLQSRRPWFDSWVWKIPWRRDRLPSPVFLGFPCGSAGKESTCNVGDLGSVPGLGRSPGEGKGYPLQYSDLENSMDCIVSRVAESQTWLRDFHFSSFTYRKVHPFKAWFSGFFVCSQDCATITSI